MNIYKAKFLREIENDKYELLTPHLSTINPAAIKWFSSIETLCSDCDEVLHCLTNPANIKCKKIILNNKVVQNEN